MRNKDTGTVVLGVPIGDDAHVGAVMEVKRKAWADRLNALLELPKVRRRGPPSSSGLEPGVQCAMYIARKCESHRLMFYLRTVPAAQWRHVMSRAADDMRDFVLKVSGCDVQPHEMFTYSKIMAAQPLRNHGFGLTDPSNIADIALGCSLAQCVDFLGEHAPTRHIRTHWSGLRPVRVSGNDVVLEPPPLPLDHTEAACTTDYEAALTRLWDMVPKYLTQSYDAMATLANSGTFPTSLLTDIEKLQHSLSKGRHRTVLLSLERHLTVDVPTGDASTPTQRTQRHEALQLLHIATAASEGGGTWGSHTGAILNLLPMYPGRTVHNATLRFFTINMLRLWPDTTTHLGPYGYECPLCGKKMYNFVVHALACTELSKLRRHDKCLDPLVDLVVALGSDVPHKEPPGSDPARQTRPDIEFRKKKTNVTCGYDVFKIGKYNVADLTVVSLAKALTVNHVSPPGPERPWIPARREKEQKHTHPPNVCLPVVTTVLGALDPYFTRWLMDAIESGRDHVKNGNALLRQFFSTFLMTLWRHNTYIYESYISRLGGVEGLSTAALPPRL